MVDEPLLVKRAVAGDRNALDCILREIQDDLYRFLYRLSGSDADLAEDLLQETLIAACRGIRSFHGDSSFRTWVLGIGKNVLRQSWRRRKLEAARQQALRGMRQLEGPSATDVPVFSRMATRIQDAFSSLATGQQEALYLHEILGCTYAEAAEILGISTDAMKNRIYNGRIRLKRALTRAPVAAGQEQLKRGH